MYYKSRFAPLIGIGNVITHMHAKDMSINDTDYSCPINAIELTYGAYITPHHATSC